MDEITAKENMKIVPLAMASARHILHTYTITHLIFYSKSRLPSIVFQYVRYFSSRRIINYTLIPLHIILHLPCSRIEFTFIQVLRRQSTIQPNTNYIPFYIRIGRLRAIPQTLTSVLLFFPCQQQFFRFPAVAFLFLLF